MNAEYLSPAHGAARSAETGKAAAYRDPTAWLGIRDSNSEMSSQIIPLKGRTDLQESSRIPATEILDAALEIRSSPQSTLLHLVEQGYGVCGARDEPAHAGKQQQFVNELGHDILPGAGPPAKVTTGSGNFGSSGMVGTEGSRARLFPHYAAANARRPQRPHRLAGHVDGVSGLVAAVSGPLGGCASD
jgi:hypothetical protein